MLRNNCNGKQSLHVFKQVLACTAAGLVMLSTGMAYGFSGVLLAELEQDDSITYDRSYDSWVASSMPLSAVFACVVAGPIIDKLGRKFGVMLVVLPLILGFLLKAFAKTVVLLLIGRSLTGICAGAIRPCALVYLGEITDPKYRSAALSSTTLTLYIGVLCCQFINNYVYWRTCCFLFTVPSLLGLLILLYLRESPLWYILKERVDEGIVTFQWFRGNCAAAQNELRDVLKNQKSNAEMTKHELLEFVFSKSITKPFLTVVILFLCIQFMGLNNITFYAQDIVQDIFLYEVDSFSMILVINAMRVVSSLVMCSIINRLPSKITFLCCAFIACAFSFSVATLLHIDTELTWLCIFCMIGYVFVGHAAMSLSWSFIPEIFPGKVRGFASGLGSSVNFIILFTCVNVTPRIRLAYGQEILFIIYGGSTLICSVILCFLLPETKGKTLQQIEDAYVNGRGSSTDL